MIYKQVATPSWRAENNDILTMERITNYCHWHHLEFRLAVDLDGRPFINQPAHAVIMYTKKICG
jgi:hypothetical protein